MILTDTEFCDHTVEVHLPAALTREVLQRVVLAGVEVEAGAASVRMFVGYNVTVRRHCYKKFHPKVRNHEIGSATQLA